MSGIDKYNPNRKIYECLKLLIPENPESGFSCAYIRVGYKQFRINRHFVFYQVPARKVVLTPRLMGEVHTHR
jgi:hypothetical protein